MASPFLAHQAALETQESGEPSSQPCSAGTSPCLLQGSEHSQLPAATIFGISVCTVVGVQTLVIQKKTEKAALGLLGKAKSVRGKGVSSCTPL